MQKEYDSFLEKIKSEQSLKPNQAIESVSYTHLKEMARKQGVTEQLKAEDMMRWVGLMNNIRACADEIVLNDIVSVSYTHLDVYKRQS